MVTMAGLYFAPPLSGIPRGYPRLLFAPNGLQCGGGRRDTELDDGGGTDRGGNRWTYGYHPVVDGLNICG